MSKKPLVVAIKAQVDGAMRSMKKLAGSIDKIAGAAKNADNAVKRSSDETKKAAEAAEKGLKRLGVKSDKTHAKQVASIKENIANLKELKKQGVITGREYSKAFQSANMRIDNLNRSIGTLDHRLKAAGTKMKSIGRNMSIGLTAPIVGFFYKSVEAQKVQEKAVASVEAALTSMGQTAGFTSKQLQDMASSIQDNSLYGDEEILQKVTANLLTFGNVSGDVFVRTQKLAADMSALLGQDLQSSAIMLGKALNDPAKGLTALTRVGVSFSAQQTEQIKAMSKAGRVAEAQGVMLKALEQQYKGQAKAQSELDSGKMQHALMDIGDAMEKVGAVLIPILAKVAKWISWAAKKFQGLSDSTQTWVVVIGAAVAILGPVIIFIGMLVAAIGAIAGALSPVAIGIAALVAVVVGGVALIYKNFDWLWGMLKAGASKFAGYITNAFKAYINAWKTVLSWIWDTLKNIGSAVGNGIATVIKAYVDMWTSAITGAFGFIKKEALAVYDWLKSFLPDWLTGGSVNIPSAQQASAQLKTAAGKSNPAAAGTPINLTVGGETYGMTASQDVADAMAKNQNLKSGLRPTSLPRTFR
ncbi:hypothetical protein BMI91_19600 [Thioclava sediminum]|uniref:Bacteriophage tail tape measure N-terminal domain-containing protein n=1 Tax=Thioclava sediminum TaxID=1915319 RepID=A0ABX3MWG5_9RHOB|nr:phage tail length tape measure family protein [Thioclava sediminum]OOY22489.1 hypothetical protein BMI91_19600 [Thioclava sediminum]